MNRIIPSIIITAAVSAALSGQAYAKVYPRLDLQNCWVNVIKSGNNDFDSVNRSCALEREVVEMDVPEATRPVTRESLDIALKKQLEKLSRRSSK